MEKPKDHLSQETTRTLFWVELVCAECSATTAGDWSSGRVNVREMKKVAEREGWSFGGIHAFCSANCRSGFIKKNPAVEENQR